MNDPITSTMVNLYSKWGPGTLLFALLIVYAVVTSSTAYFERRSHRYIEEGKESFHRNFSTLLDFFVLNPALIVIAAYTTHRMINLPTLLSGKSTLSTGEFDALGNTLATLLSTKFLFPIVLSAALVAWVMYIRSLRKFERLGGFWKSQSVTTHYVGIATILIMYVIVTFIYRSSCFLWYVANVTKGGLRPDPIEWAVALESIGRVLVGVNWFFILLALVVFGFVVHDWILNPNRLRDRSLRVLVAPAFVVVVALGFIFGPMFSIHDNLLEAKVDHIERLIAHRRDLDGPERAAITERIREVRLLREWPLTGRQTLLPALGQILAFIASAFLAVFGPWICEMLSPFTDRSARQSSDA